MNSAKDSIELSEELLKANEKITLLESKIADLEKRENALRQNDELFHLLLKYSPIHIFFKDEEIRAICLSDNFEKMLNRPINDIIGKTMDELFPSDLAKNMIEDDKNVLQNGVPLKIIEKFGDQYFSTIKFPIIKQDGAPLLAGFTIEITDQKLMEIDLKENEERINTLINSTPDIICFKDGKGRWLKANQADLELFCLTDVDYFMKTDSELAPFTAPLYKDSFLFCEVTDEIAWKAGSTTRNEERIPTINDEEKVYDVIKIPVFYKDGSRKGLVVFGRDITDRKKAEEEIKKSEKLYRTLIESADDGIVLLDKDFKSIVANAAYYKIFGFTPQDNPDLSDNKYVHPDDLENVKAKQLEALEKGSGFSECRVIQKGGKVVDVSSKSVVIYNEAGEREQILSIIRDITDSKNKERELLQLNATKDKFFGIIAHDLRSPFHGYLGLTEAILSDLYDLSLSDLNHLMSKLHESASNLYKLLNNLLDWSKIQQGVVELKPANISFSENLDEVLSIMEQNLLQKNIELIKEIETGLSVYADVNMLNTILRNFISNAIKFSYFGGKIRISAGNYKNGMTHIAIEDKGIGMNETTLNKLFKIEEKFQEKGTEGEEGSGLGLLICKEMVELQGGSVWINSEPDNGSTFHFTLPVLKN